MIFYRTKIAAMHYNFNAERAIKLTADGEEQYAQRWSKADKQWRLIVLKEAAAYGKNAWSDVIKIRKIEIMGLSGTIYGDS